MAGIGEEDDDQNGSSPEKKTNQSGTIPQKKTKPRSQTKTKADSAEKDAAERLRKAQLESKIQARVASEAKAFDIVNRLIEPSISTEYFLKAVCMKVNVIQYILQHKAPVLVCTKQLTEFAFWLVSYIKLEVHGIASQPNLYSSVAGQQALI